MSLLEVKALVAGYGDFQALYGIDLQLAAGEVLAIVGANGAGKTTFLRALAGALPVRNGSLHFEDRDITHAPAHEICAAGMALVPEGRRLFPSLNVKENLLMGAYLRRPGPWSLAQVYALFPILEQFHARPATDLSGGQQQMVAIGRALMSNPRLLLCDEISLGLAPRIVKDIYRVLPKVREQGVAILLVEQDIAQAFKVADRVVCLREGRIVLEGQPGTLSRDDIAAAYFGTGQVAEVSA